MRISYPTKTEIGDRVKLATEVVSGPDRRELQYWLPLEYGDWFAADRCDGFVVGLLLQAMTRRENLEVEGPLSSRLFHSLQAFFIPMMAQAFPDLHRVDIIPSSLTETPTAGRYVATGFSGGIDSFAAVIQHFVQEQSLDHRISHFLFNNAGSHGCNPDESRKLFCQRFEKLQPFAREIGLPVIAVDSNLHEVLPISFITMHSALNASVPLVLQNRVRRYYYASAFKYADCGVKWTDDLARFDPLAFHLFSTEGLDCISTGCQMSRIEKTELVASYEPSSRFLNVCVDPSFEGRNCSTCFKCCRTILTLELLGVIDAYREVFDLERFSRVRNRYLSEVFRYSSGSFEHEIADLIRQRGSKSLQSAFRVRKLWDRLAWR